MPLLIPKIKLAVVMLMKLPPLIMVAFLKKNLVWLDKVSSEKIIILTKVDPEEKGI